MRNVLPLPKTDQEWATFVGNLNRQLDELDATANFLRSIATSIGAAGHIISNNGVQLYQRPGLNFAGGVEARDSAAGQGSTEVQRSALAGDVVASTGSGSTTIQPGVVTLAKMADIATDKLIGRDTAGTGVPEALAISGGLEFTGAGGIQTSALTGDVTKTSGGTSTTIANDAVTYAKMQNVSATDKLLGRSTAGAGDVEEIPCTAFVRTILDDVDAAAVRTTIGATGGRVQASQITSVKVVSTTSEVSLLTGTMVGTLTLPAGFFVAGKLLRIVMRGLLSVLIGDTLTFRVKLGASALSTVAFTGFALTDKASVFYADLLCRTVGGTGTVEAAAEMRTNTAAAVESVFYAATAETVVDTTGTLVLDVTLQPSTSSVSEYFKADLFVAHATMEP